MPPAINNSHAHILHHVCQDFPVCPKVRRQHIQKAGKQFQLLCLHISVCWFMHLHRVLWCLMDLERDLFQHTTSAVLDVMRWSLMVIIKGFLAVDGPSWKNYKHFQHSTEKRKPPLIGTLWAHNLSLTRFLKLCCHLRGTCSIKQILTIWSH